MWSEHGGQGMYASSPLRVIFQETRVTSKRNREVHTMALTISSIM
jgi:hypothetical protein